MICFNNQFNSSSPTSSEQMLFQFLLIEWHVKPISLSSKENLLCDPRSPVQLADVVIRTTKSWSIQVYIMDIRVVFLYFCVQSWYEQLFYIFDVFCLIGTTTSASWAGGTRPLNHVLSCKRCYVYEIGTKEGGKRIRKRQKTRVVEWNRRKGVGKRNLS